MKGIVDYVVWSDFTFVAVWGLLYSKHTQNILTSLFNSWESDKFADQIAEALHQIMSVRKIQDGSG